MLTFRPTGNKDQNPETKDINTRSAMRWRQIWSFVHDLRIALWSPNLIVSVFAPCQSETDAGLLEAHLKVLHDFPEAVLPSDTGAALELLR